ncbi:MAG TPA: heme ABC exporter ATP-binding protein CcmA [Actinomycetota bacterium]|nr:heme ABC exporter ATP-binding protein CcmA [Actinomycetota bacterium]
MIVAEGLTVVFGRTVALASIDLAIPPGVVGVFGPNGSGKSTLLRVVAGLLSPRRGRVTWRGSPVTARAESFRRAVGYAGHAAGLYGRLSVRENLELFATLCGAPRARVEGLIEAVRLEAVASTAVADLSAGVRRRAAVARALVGEPELLLLDEPYANLDDDASEAVSDAVRHWRAPGRTALIATHGAKRLKAWADAGLVLQGGRVAAWGRYGAEERPSRRGAADG